MVDPKDNNIIFRAKPRFVKEVVNGTIVLIKIIRSRKVGCRGY